MVLAFAQAVQSSHPCHVNVGQRPPIHAQSSIEGENDMIVLLVLVWATLAASAATCAWMARWVAPPWLNGHGSRQRNR